MAQRIITQLISDLSGDEVAQGKGETLEFSYRGQNYSIDLTEKEAAGFDKAVAMYIDHATKIGRSRSVGNFRRATPSSDTKAIREWAQANGYEVGDRGRIPAEVKDAYAAAN